MFESLLTTLGLLLIIEGIGPTLFPNRWRSYLSKIAKEHPNNLRIMGVVMLLLGSLLLTMK